MEEESLVDIAIGLLRKHYGLDPDVLHRNRPRALRSLAKKMIQEADSSRPADGTPGRPRNDWLDDLIVNAVDVLISESRRLSVTQACETACYQLRQKAEISEEPLRSIILGLSPESVRQRYKRAKNPE